MMRLRILLGFLAVLAVAMLAAPARADNKSFSIAVSPSPLAGSSWTITVTYTNNASGNSTFNSLELDWTPAINVSSAKLTQSGATLQPSSFTPGGSSAVFTNLSPVKPGKSVTVTLVATATGTSCAQAGVTWTPKAWTGSPTSPSNVFTAIPATTTTTITPACSLAFVYQPAAAIAGAPIAASGGNAVAVELRKADGTPDKSYAGKIGLSIKSGTGTSGAALAGGTAITIDPSTGFATFPNLSIDKPGTGYVLTASADTGGFASVDSNAFTVFSGVLGCTSDNNFASGTTGNGVTNAALDPDQDAAYTGDPSWALRRGPNWDDPSGGNCVQVDYSFNLDPSRNVATFLWDKSSGQHGAFKYVILWSAFTVDTSTTSTTGVVSPAGWSSVRPSVSWGIANPTPGTSDFVPALVCAGDDLTQGQALLPTIPNVWPFNDPATPPQYQPFDSNGNPQKAKVCIAQTGFTAVGRDANGNVLVQYFDKVVDEADAVIVRNP